MATTQLMSLDTATLNVTSPREISEVVAAFLNTSGGRLLLGIDEGGRVEGVDAYFDSETISEILKDLISPEPRFSITHRNIGEKTIVLIDVPVGSERPYVVDDRIFVWKAGELVNAAPMEISNMIISRGNEVTRWEHLPATGIDVEDLDQRQLARTMEDFSDRSSHQRRHGLDFTSFLSEIGGASAGQLLNSSVVLFARPEIGFPQNRVRVAAFESEDRTAFIENKLLDGNLFDLFEQITLFLDRHISVSSKFEEFERHDVMAIPPFVIREAVMNALVHRDYSQANANVMIALHPDRLEIWNPGLLPEGISPENLARTQVSRPTNPDIANVAFMRGLIEQWGSGTGRIVSECRRAGLREPEWSSVGGGVRLVIYLKSKNENLEHSINERMSSFILRTYPGQVISLDDYHLKWAKNISIRTARRDLEEMVDMGYLDIRSHRPLTFVRSDKAEL